MSSNPDNIPPPLFRSWNQLYIFVIAVLLVQIILYYFITEYLK